MKKHGFDLTDISAADWQIVLSSVEAGNQAEQTRDGWEWSGQNILIVTANNPITGEYCNGSRKHEKGYASYIGVEGSPSKVKMVVDGIREFATFIKDECRNARDFI